MREFKITRWNGVQLEAINVFANDVATALGTLPYGMYDSSVVSVVEVPGGTQ